MQTPNSNENRLFKSWTHRVVSHKETSHRRPEVETVLELIAQQEKLKIGQPYRFTWLS